MDEAPAEQGDVGKPEAASNDESLTNSGGTSSSSKPSSSYQSNDGTLSKKGSSEGNDITKDLVPLESSLVGGAKQVATKEIYLNCEFVMPGIALKKFSMCLQDPAFRAESYVAAVGGGTCKMYKKVKPCARGMVIGDYKNQRDRFWEQCSKHLGSKKCAGIMVFDVFADPIGEAGPWFKLHFSYQNKH